MRHWIRFSLLSVLIAVTVVCACFAIFHASLYKREPFAQRVHGVIGSDLFDVAFRVKLDERIEDLGFRRNDGDDEAQTFASYRMVHNDCVSEPVVYRGSLPNGKVCYLHCYYSQSRHQPEMRLYSISVSFFETPYERWNTKGLNQLQARELAFTLRAEARSLVVKLLHAEHRRLNGLLPE